MQQPDDGPQKGGVTAHIVKSHSALENKVSYVTILAETITHSFLPAFGVWQHYFAMGSPFVSLFSLILPVNQGTLTEHTGINLAKVLGKTVFDLPIYKLPPLNLSPEI